MQECRKLKQKMRYFGTQLDHDFQIIKEMCLRFPVRNKTIKDWPITIRSGGHMTEPESRSATIIETDWSI